MTNGQTCFSYHYSSVGPTWRSNCQAGQPPCASVSSLLYTHYLLLCRFSCFELFKFQNSALRFSNVEVHVSAHCMLNATLFISHSSEVEKMQHHIYIAFRRSCQTATLKFRELWYQYTILRQTINKQTIKILAKVQMY